MLADGLTKGDIDILSQQFDSEDMDVWFLTADRTDIHSSRLFIVYISERRISEYKPISL